MQLSYNLNRSINAKQIVYRVRRADFAREYCSCRNSRENRQANWGFAETRLEFQLQPRRFRLRRGAENGKSQLCKSITRSHKVSTLPRWLLTRHPRVCAGLHKVSTCEPCDRSKVYTGVTLPSPITHRGELSVLTPNCQRRFICESASPFLGNGMRKMPIHK